MAAVIGLALGAGKAGVIALFAFASFVALREYATIAPGRRGDHWALLTSFFVVIPFQYFLVWLEWYGLFSIFIPVYAFLVLPMVRGDLVRRPQLHAARRDAAVGLDDQHVLPVACSRAADARHPGIRGPQRVPDRLPGARRAVERVFQYVWGKLFGKRKIAPKSRRRKRSRDSSAVSRAPWSVGRACGGSRRSRWRSPR
jgi:phosphatidate cytidylyltransferase